jgi:hypothetical protein
VPEIDILEAEKDKEVTTGQVVSQSVQSALFTHDYVYLNATEDEWKVFDVGRSRLNVYKRIAVSAVFFVLLFASFLFFF